MTDRQHESRMPWYAPFVPPGMAMGGELSAFGIGMFLSFCYSGGFLIRFFQALEDLYVYSHGERTLIPGAVMPPFYALFGHTWLGYYLVLLCMLGYGIYHVLYYRQGAASIYLMRRLPDRFAYIRCTWTSTVCAVLLCLLAAALCLLLSYGIYHWGTPDGCIADGQWTLFWDNLVYRK